MSKMSAKGENKDRDSCINKKYQKILIHSKDQLCGDTAFPSVTSIVSSKAKPVRNVINKLKPKPFDVKILKPDIFKFVPDKIHFSDYKAGLIYKITVKATNISNKISRIAIVPPRSKVFAVTILTGPKHSENNLKHETKDEKDTDCCNKKISGNNDCLIRDGVWAAAPGTSVCFSVTFSPTNELGDISEMVLKIQGGDDVIIPLSALNNPPILDGYVIGGPLHKMPSQLTWSSRYDEEQVDVMEVGAALLGGEGKRELVLHNQGGQATFFILLEETWIRSCFQDVSLVNELVAPPFTVWPVYFSIGKKGTVKLQLGFKPRCPCISCPHGRACRGCDMCPQCQDSHQCSQRPEVYPHDTALGCSAFGLHVERLAIVCSNGIVRYVHLLADGIQFPKKPLQINLPNKIYDIDTDGDSLCQYFLDLGVIFPKNTCNIGFILKNLSEVPFEIRWVFRQPNSKNRSPWPHREKGWCQDRCGGLCSNCCGGLCFMTLNGGIMEPEAYLQVKSVVMSQDFPPGKYSTVIGLIIMNIPEASLPEDFAMKRFITTKYSIQDIETNYVNREKYDILAYEIEVWLEVKLPEVFLDPCLVELIGEPLMYLSKVVQKSVTVLNLSENSIKACWKREETADTNLPIKIIPENFTVAPGNDLVCNFFITVISELQIVEEVLILDVHCGLLQKKLVIRIDVATPRTQLVPFRNTRVECLKRSDVLGAPPYVAPLAILSLPDVLYVGIHQVVSVVLRNTTPVTMDYEWGEPIGENSDDLDITITPKSGTIVGCSTREIYINVLPKRSTLLRDFVIPCTVGELEEILPLAIICFVENLCIEFKIQDKFDENYDVLLDWILWSQKMEYFECNEISDVSYSILSSDDMDYESMEDRKSYLFEDEITPDSKWGGEEEGDDYDDVSWVIPDNVLLPFIRPKSLLPIIFLVPKIEINQMSLNEVVTRTVLIRNITPIPTYFNVGVTNYPAICKDSPEDTVRKMVAKINGKRYTDIMPEKGAGLGILAFCSSSQLPPYGVERVQIEIISDTWGTYRDTVNIQVEGLAALPIQLMTQVVGNPLKAAEELRFGSHLIGGPDAQRYLNVTNTSGVPLLVYWHVFDDEDNELYEGSRKEVPFSLLLNIGNENTLLEFTSPESSYDLALRVESSESSPRTNKFPFEEKYSQQTSIQSSTESITIKSHVELPADNVKSDASLIIQKSYKSKNSNVFFKTRSSKLPDDDSSLSLKSDEKISRSEKSYTSSRRKTPYVRSSETFHSKYCSSNGACICREIVEEFEDLTSPSSGADDDVKLQLCLTDYCGRSTEDYFVIEPRQMLLSPGETAKLSVTLKTEGHGSAIGLVNLNRSLIAYIRCHKKQSEELCRDFPPLNSTTLTARLLLPRVVVCEAKSGIVFTTHAVKLFSSPLGYFRLRKSLVIYNPHELSAAGTIIVGQPFTLKPPENTFNIPPKSSYKVKIECTATTAMCLKGCLKNSKRLKMEYALQILQDRLPNQIVIMELIIQFPLITVEPTFIDFGPCPVKDSLIRYFKAENLTDQEMECTVSPGWRCLGAWTVEPSTAVLQPARCGGVKPAVFTLTFTPRLREGDLSTSILVNTPVPNCTFKVRVVGRGVPQVSSEASVNTQQ